MVVFTLFNNNLPLGGTSVWLLFLSYSYGIKYSLLSLILANFIGSSSSGLILWFNVVYN